MKEGFNDVVSDDLKWGSPYPVSHFYSQSDSTVVTMQIQYIDLKQLKDFSKSSQRIQNGVSKFQYR